MDHDCTWNDSDWVKVENSSGGLKAESDLLTVNNSGELKIENYRNGL